MEWRRAGIAHITTKTILALCLFLAAGVFVANSPSADAASAPLHVGSSGPEVSTLQQILKDQGYFAYPTITGYYGSATWKAVAAFQWANGLEAVGYVGPTTRALLDSLSPSTLAQSASSTPQSSLTQTSSCTPLTLTRPLDLGVTGADVTSLQQFLAAQGLLTVAPTGYFGPLTAQVVLAFQKANDIEAVGIVGPLTRAKLATCATTPTALFVQTSGTAATTTASTTPSWYTRPLPGYAPGQIIFAGGSAPAPVSPSDTTPPSAPTTFTATVNSSSQIALSWTASTDNVGVTGYRVFRNGTQIGTPSGNSFNDSGLSPAMYNAYTVEAYDAAGNVSTPSTLVTAVTSDGPDAYGTTWHQLKIGDGGQVSGIDIAPDNTIVVRTDSYGAYIWNGTQWQSLVTSSSMPAAFAQPTHDKIIQGVYEVRVASSNSNVLYMEYKGYLFKSINRGATWTQTALAPATGESANGNFKFMGQKMAIDPNNPNVVVVGTPQAGLFITTNGGDAWQSASSVPASLQDSSSLYPGFSGIAFDPALGVTGGRTNTIFAASYGNGVYESTDGGGTWASIGGPLYAMYGTASSDGAYYAVNATTTNQALWKYVQNTGWTQLFSDSGNGIRTVAVDPFNPNEIVTQASSGGLHISYDGGSSWSSFNGGGNSVVSADIPWLTTASNSVVPGAQPWLSTAGTVFDQVTPNKVWSAVGVGVSFTTNLPTSNFLWNTPVVWNDQSAGIEQLVASGIVVPTGGHPVVASWDRPFFYINNPNTYPTAYAPWTGGNLREGFSIDYASTNSSFLVGIANNWGYESSGYSTDGGQSWNQFQNHPGGGHIGGTIAASTPTNIVWAPSGGVQPYYTTDGGQNWNPITLPGVSDWTAFHWSYNFNARTVAADRVLSNTFYLYYAGKGVFKSTDGGATWVKVYSGSDGSNGTISANSQYNATLASVPGKPGELFFTGGPQTSLPSQQFYKSTDGGAHWTAVPNVTEVNCFGFGAAAPGQSYPSIYIVGWVSGIYGIWQSVDDAQSWTQIGTYPNGDLDLAQTISGDPYAFGRVYVGFSGSGYAYGDAANAQIPPSFSSIAVSGIPTTNAAVTWSTDQSSNSTVVYGTTSAYGSTTSSGSFVTSHSISLTGLNLLAVTYHYAVVSTNAQGYTATSTDQTFTTVNNTAPSVPANFTATATSTSEIDLSWNASTGNGTYPIAGYQIFRNGTQVGTTTSGTAYADTGLTASTTYTYAVDAYDTGGNVSAQTTGVSTSTLSAAATFTPGPGIATNAIINANFASTTETFSGLNGSTNFPSGAVVVVGIGGDLGHTPIAPLIGGQAATLVSGSQNTGKQCVLYQATMPASEPDTFSFQTAGSWRLTGVAGIGYFQNLTSQTAFSAGNETYAGQVDPQFLSSTLTVPAGGFGVVYAWDGATKPTAFTWTNTTSSSGDNFESATVGSYLTAIGSAHLATASSTWNPTVRGVGQVMNYASCMSAATWH